MIQKVLLSLLLASSVFAQTYSFTELRYSDAINRSTQLEGKISFTKNGLNISYPQSAREIDYDNDTLNYYENGKIVQLPEMQSSKMMQYFDILRLLHKGDESELEGMFEIEDRSNVKILKPLGAIKNYINLIELRKYDNELKYIKLFLQNNDTISININD
ncbi:MAG: hypothetical protein M0Q24_07975 [Sulfurimonas sp.]|uniref:hypothetical protein n=1 Tax=Sulfurimonas sp. TaxID=2022749 RepID=UPI0025D49108|nr:hypothetical protein [Sulfurimonas sp.]MCK9492013.1 hypothetical protein [Sulfurimonas sp.]